MPESKNLKNKGFFILPRGYLSHTQFSLWRKSRERYKEHYFFGKEGYSNHYMTLGKELAKALESDEPTKNQAIETARVFFPAYTHRELRLEVKKKPVVLLGILDGMRGRGHIGDHKASLNWTQAMTDRSTQLTWYAMLYYLEKGKLPASLSIHWAKTKKKDGQLYLTGALKTFETTRTLADVLKMYAEAKKVAAEISEEFTGWTK